MCGLNAEAGMCGAEAGMCGAEAGTSKPRCELGFGSSSHCMFPSLLCCSWVMLLRSTKSMRSSCCALRCGVVVRR
jgi:hypothetical protein